MSDDISPSQNPVNELNEHEIRVEKVTKLRAMGVEPWPPTEEVSSTTRQILDTYAPEKESETYTIAGRILTLRGHGKTVFAHVQDRSGKLQVYIRQDVVGDQKFNFLQQYLDVGDIIWCKGSPFITKTGEITLKVSDFALLSKSLFPLPEKFHGLTDVEVRYRQRYLDLISNPESREKFIKRSHIVRFLREYLNSNDFLEVETPMLHPIPGGAAARPFITHHNAYGSDFYLRIAPELYLKRLVVGGIERVYEINRNFRNEGVSTRHNPEFTMLEFYMAYQDYHFIMNFVETMLRQIAQKVSQTVQVPYGDHVIDFGAPFDRISPRQAVLKYSSLKESDLTAERIDATLQQQGVEVPGGSSLEIKIFALFEKLAEPKLIQPTFIINFPVENSPLAKRDAKNPNIAARFELFVAGMELANGFNELNDPFDQAQRFQEQAQQHASGNVEAMHYDAEYVHALEYGLPPTVGVGVGVDRLTMLLSNTTSIKDVILFPTLKRKESV